MSFMYMYLGLQNQWQAGCIVMSSRMDLGYGSSELRLVGFIVGGWGSCAFYLSGIMDLDILLEGGLGEGGHAPPYLYTSTGIRDYRIIGRYIQAVLPCHQ